jgi:hypothetical protein
VFVTIRRPSEGFSPGGHLCSDLGKGVSGGVEGRVGPGRPPGLSGYRRTLRVVIRWPDGAASCVQVAANPSSRARDAAVVGTRYSKWRKRSGPTARESAGECPMSPPGNPSRRSECWKFRRRSEFGTHDFPAGTVRFDCM